MFSKLLKDFTGTLHGLFRICLLEKQTWEISKWILWPLHCKHRVRELMKEFWYSFTISLIYRDDWSWGLRTELWRILSEGRIHKWDREWVFCQVYFNKPKKAGASLMKFKEAEMGDDDMEPVSRDDSFMNEHLITWLLHVSFLLGILLLTHNLTSEMSKQPNHRHFLIVLCHCNILHYWLLKIIR